MVYGFEQKDACKYGLLESVILEVMRKVIIDNSDILNDFEDRRYLHDGMYWMSASYSSIAKMLQFANERQVKYAIGNLEQAGAIIKGDFNGSSTFRKNWYSIPNFAEETLILCTGQNCPMHRTKLSDQEKEKKRKEPKEKNNKENNYIYNNITNTDKEKINVIPKGITQNKEKNCGSDEPCSDKSERCIIKDIVDYLNEVTGKHFRDNSQSTIRYIRASLNDGNTLDDFKKVISYKHSQWGNDQKMKEYLRPETLFGTKFESYLNSAPDDFQVDDKPKDDEKTEIDKWLDEMGYQ